MNLLRVSFTAASHKTFRHILRSAVSTSNVNIMIRSFATGGGNLESEQVIEKISQRSDFVTSYTLINDMPESFSYLCKHDMYDDAYRVLNEISVSGFSHATIFDILKEVLDDFLLEGDQRKAFEMQEKMRSWNIHGLSNEATYTSFINAYLDKGKFNDARKLLDYMLLFGSLPESVLYSVFINGLDNKDRTTEIKKSLLRFNYDWCLHRPILEYHSTMVENSSDDEFKSVVELVEGICSNGFENVLGTMLKSNYKPDGIDYGIVYNLFIIAHCKHSNVDEAYIMYKEMLHYGFACHMFTVFALIKTLKTENMVNELLLVIQNVLRSCNLNDSEIVKFLNEFNPEKYYSEALLDVLAEKAKDGLFLKCSCAPPSA